MNTFIKPKMSVLILSFFIWAAYSSPVSAAEQPARIAVLPFKVNAEKDYSFLRDGIYDMLTSRLTLPGQVQVISRSEAENVLQTVTGSIDEAVARQIGEKLSVNFVLFGSLTIFGDSLSLDAKMIDVSGTKPTLAFFNQSPDMGQIIPKINQFAAEINEKAFGRTMVVKTAPVVAAPTPKTAPKAEIYSHPEKLLKPDEDKKRARRQPAASDAPHIMSREQAVITPTFWKSRNFKYLINGLTVGDVTGDGLNETVIVTPNEVRIYRTENNHFFQIHRVAEKKRNYYIGVDVADINANGYPEIFVTGLNTLKNDVSSMVFEFDGSKFNTIVKNSPWYYRVVDMPDRGRILLGQKNRSGSPYGGSIFELIWQNREYVADKHIKTPRHINVLGFSQGMVLEDGLAVSVAYEKDNYLQVIDPAGEVIWKNSDRLGGSTLYYADSIDNPGGVENKIYLPMRLVVRNNGSLGESEVVAVKNYEVFNMGWERRHFNEAHIESLYWDGLGLATNWKTRKFSGHIRDFAIGDFDNDGKTEVVAAVILKEGEVITTRPKTTVIAYEVK